MRHLSWSPSLFAKYYIYFFPFWSFVPTLVIMEFLEEEKNGFIFSRITSIRCYPERSHYPFHPMWIWLSNEFMHGNKCQWWTANRQVYVYLLLFYTQRDSRWPKKMWTLTAVLLRLYYACTLETFILHLVPIQLLAKRNTLV